MKTHQHIIDDEEYQDLVKSRLELNSLLSGPKKTERDVVLFLLRDLFSSTASGPNAINVITKHLNVLAGKYQITEEELEAQ